jgi:hypothetical protein
MRIGLELRRLFFHAFRDEDTSPIWIRRVCPGSRRAISSALSASSIAAEVPPLMSIIATSRRAILLSTTLDVSGLVKADVWCRLLST